MTGRPAAERGPKARRTGVVSCGHLVLQGQRIYKKLGERGWICQECRRNRNLPAAGPVRVERGR